MSIPDTYRQYHLLKGGFDNLAIKQVSTPKLKSTEVLIKVHAVSLQYRDLVVCWGKYPGAKHEVVPCSDLAGSIVQLGSEVSPAWRVGDRVCSNFAYDHIDGDLTPEIQATGLGAPVDGVLAEYKVIPAHALVRIPEHLSYEEASTLPCAALTAWNALIGPKPIKAGDTVLVQGTGGVSIFALQFAVASGAVVFVTSSSDEKLAVAKKLGATHLINYSKNPDWDVEVAKITNGRGIDHIIEVGGPGTLERSAKAVRYAGWIHSIGFVSKDGGDVSVPGYAVRKAFIIRGIQIGSVAQFVEMNRLISAHKLKPVIDRVFPFEQAIDAFHYQASQAHVGKVVVKVVQ